MGIRVIIFFVALLAVSCTRPRTIPRDEMKEIFKQAFLVNAYYDANSGFMWGDSMDMYRPILERRGYRVVDLEHTVANFSKKKSAKVSDVVEQALAELEAESKWYDDRMAMLDTMDMMAERAFRREVLWRDSIVVRVVKDTAGLRVTMPLVGAGQYGVSYSYRIDSLEQNAGLRASGVVVDTTGGRRMIYVLGNYLRTSGRQRVEERRFDVGAGDSVLEILLAGYPVKRMKRPRMRVDSILVMYYLPRERALDSLRGRLLDFGFYGARMSQDSVALRPFGRRMDSVAGGGR